MGHRRQWERGDWVEVVFGARGGPIAVDHGWQFFAAACAHVPGLHGGDGDDHSRQIMPSTVIDGVPIAAADGRSRWLDLVPRSHLRVRCLASRLEEVTELGDKTLSLGGRPLSLTTPLVRPMRAWETLVSRLVVFGYTKPGKGRSGDLSEARFRQALFARLKGMGLELDPTQVDVGRRRKHQVRHHYQIGYGVRLRGLNVRQSRILQIAGIGGRRHQGCGFFVEPRGATPLSEELQRVPAVVPAAWEDVAVLARKAWIDTPLLAEDRIWSHPSSRFWRMEGDEAFGGAWPVGEGWWRLTGCWVAPGLRGEGRGERLVRARVEALKAAGATRIDAYALRRDLFVRLGFKARGPVFKTGTCRMVWEAS